MADPSKEYKKYATKTTDELNAQTGEPVKKSGVQAGSYSKPRRKGYEDMLKEAGEIPDPKKDNS